LTSNANYFGSTQLGKLHQKCENDHRLADILKIKYDNSIKKAKNQYHDAGYDAYLTGYVFAKVMKYKEIDSIYLEKKFN